jgi:hypothetical protein
MLKTIFAVLLCLSYFAGISNAQVDPPSGYTVYYGFKMYDEGAYPSADSVNDNLSDIDAAIYMRAQGLDSIRTAFKQLHDWPAGTFNDTTWVLGTASLHPNAQFNFGLYQGNKMNFLTQGTKRIIINQYGVVTIGSTDSVGSSRLYSGDLYVNNDFNLIGEYSSLLKFRQDSDENWLIYPGNTSEIIFGNTDLNTWFTVNAGAYKTQGTTGYLASALGSPSGSGLWVSESDGGSTHTELNSVTLTINGVTRHFLVTE